MTRRSISSRIGSRSRSPAAAIPPPMTTRSGEMHGDHVGDPDAEVGADPVEGRRSRPRPRPGPPPRPPPRSPSRTPRRCRSARANASRQPWLPQLHGGPVRIDRLVADLAGRAVVAEVDLAVDRDDAADAGPEGQPDHRARAPRPAPSRSSARPNARASLMSPVGMPSRRLGPGPDGSRRPRRPGGSRGTGSRRATGSYSPGTPMPMRRSGPARRLGPAGRSRRTGRRRRPGPPAARVGDLAAVEAPPAPSSSCSRTVHLRFVAPRSMPEVAGRRCRAAAAHVLAGDARVGRRDDDDDQAEQDLAGRLGHLQGQGSEARHDGQDQGSDDRAGERAATTEDRRPADDRGRHGRQHGLLRRATRSRSCTGRRRGGRRPPPAAPR